MKSWGKMILGDQIMYLEYGERGCFTQSLFEINLKRDGFIRMLEIMQERGKINLKD